MSATKAATRRELRVWQAWETFAESVVSRVNHELGTDAGLSSAEFRVLSTLDELGAGELRQRELAVAIGWDKSRISHQLTRMHERKLIERSKSPEAGSRVRILPAGRAALGRARVVHARAVRRHFIERLTPEQLETIGAIAERP